VTPDLGPHRHPTPLPEDTGAVRRSLRGDAAWIAAIAAGVLVCWWTRVLATAEPGPPSFGTGDLFGYFLPAYAYLRDRLHEGNLPWWNPWVGGGTPFVATLQVGALYPSRLLLLALDPVAATHVSLVVHLVLAAVAMFALCREIGASRWGALVGAVMYFMPAELPHLYFPPFLEGSAWLPVGGLAIARTLRSGAWRWTLLLGAALAMPLLAGGYQTAVYVPYGIALLGGIELASGTRRLRWPVLACRLVVAGLVALALAAPQLFVTLAWTAETARTTAALTPQQIQPYWHPSLVPMVVRMLLLQVVTTNGALNTLYVSIPGVLLALIGITMQGRRGVLLGAAALLFFLLCLGPGLPWFALYYWLPGLSWFRLPQRLSVLFVFFAALAAALGLAALGRTEARFPRRGLRWLGPVASALVIAALVVPARNRWSLPWTVPRTQPPQGAEVFEAASVIAGAGTMYVPVDALALGLGAFPRLGLARRVRVLEDYEPLSSRRLARFLYAVAGEPEPNDPAAAAFTGSVPGTTIAQPRLLDAAAVTAVLLPAAQSPPPHRPPWAEAATVGDFRVWRNIGALPRAYVVTRAWSAPSDDAALARVLAPGFDPSRDVVLAGAEALPPPPADPPPARAQSITLDAPEHVRIQLDVAEPGVLVLADAFAPGWRARVDDVERPLWMANGLVRGVRVAPSDRQVDFTYRPPGLRLALGVSSAAAVLALLIGLASTLRASPDRSQASRHPIRPSP
jgi:hypothetical protein